MGQRGPKPKPAALKMLAGNPGKRPAGGESRRVKPGVPDMPRELTGEAAAEWARVAPVLDEAGLLSVADRGTLAAYCLAVQDMLCARSEIQEHGRFSAVPIVSPKGEIVGEKRVENPAVKLLDRASLRVKQLADALGLTPLSRNRLGPPGGEGAPAVNPFVAVRERFLAAGT